MPNHINKKTRERVETWCWSPKQNLDDMPDWVRSNLRYRIDVVWGGHRLRARKSVATFGAGCYILNTDPCTLMTAEAFVRNYTPDVRCTVTKARLARKRSGCA